MKFNYTNILLFSLSLNILFLSSQVYNQRNHKSTTHHTLKIPITRLLCECELYTPANYDNDPQMKEVMDNFNRQTQQRFHEYDERMVEKRMQCKDKCDKEIQKIILKDKLEKQMAEQFSTLQTDIQNDAIPTCVCEKSLADKVEKTCLKCGGVLGGGITPGWGLISGIVYTGWKAAALAAAKKAAIDKGLAVGKAAGIEEGVKSVISGIKSKFSIDTLGGEALELVLTEQKYNNITLISESIYMEYSSTCLLHGTGLSKPICSTVNALYVVPGNVLDQSSLKGSIQKAVNQILTEAKTSSAEVTKTTTDRVILSLTAKNTGEVNATYASCQTVIIASVVAILVIVLVMVIIYLILRYRRKKKMKKKLQYIKLLKE